MSDDLKILNGFIDFSVKVYGLTGQGDGRNFVFSPLSLSLGLSTCLAGARKSTESELKHVLDYVHVSTSEIHKGNEKLIDYLNKIKCPVNFKYGYRLFHNDDVVVKTDYLDLIKKIYKTDTKALKYENKDQAIKEINDWIESETNFKFQKLVSNTIINSDIKLLLVNALYFKGNWFKKFDKYYTKLDDFHLLDGSKVKCTMMQLKNRKFKYKANAGGLNASVCEFPFVGHELSMTVILPDKDTNLTIVESQLSSETLKETLEEYNFSTKVNVHLPKFKIEESSEISESLKNEAPHSFNGFRVDFSGLTDKNTDNIHISKVISRLAVEVDEEGSESAAASGTAGTKWSSEASVTERAEEFNCNRPFLFIIHDTEYRIPLIFGKVTNPA